MDNMENALTIREEWKTINGFPDYAVSNNGRVKRLTKGRRTHPGNILKPWIDTYGYPMVTLKEKDLLVHRLVAKHFCRGKGAEVNHKNGIKNDCSAQNLEFVNRSENMKHLFYVGLASNKGEHNPKSRLTSKQVNQVRELHKAGLSYSNIARNFGVSKSCIAFVLQNKTWKEK